MTHPAILNAHIAPTGNQVTRVECAFTGCLMPPAVKPRRSRWCYAHHKQHQRGGPLRPFVPRSDPEVAWRRWAAARSAAAANESFLRLRHAGRCGGLMRVASTNHNGVQGKRVCVCTRCQRYVQVMPDGSMYATGKVNSSGRLTARRGSAR